MTVHMQVAENDRVEAATTDALCSPRIRFYACSPGLLKTAFTRFLAHAKEPEAGAEVAVRLLLDDKKDCEGGSFWEFEEGEMRKVPW